MRYRGRYLFGITAVELVIALSRLHLQSPAGVPGGDPGGTIHRSLQRVAAALPGDARVMSRYDTKAVWSACGGRPGAAGWQDPVVAVTFRSGADARTVVTRADTALTSMGWAPVPDMNDTIWARFAGMSNETGTARLTLNADRSWTLTASAVVPGPHAPC